MLFCNKTFYILFQLLAFGEYFMALGKHSSSGGDARFLVILSLKFSRGH